MLPDSEKYNRGHIIEKIFLLDSEKCNRGYIIETYFYRIQKSNTGHITEKIFLPDSEKCNRGHIIQTLCLPDSEKMKQEGAHNRKIIFTYNRLYYKFIFLVKSRVFLFPLKYFVFKVK
jgi:hypothetical protein